jgi:hypothetical protein
MPNASAKCKKSVKEFTARRGRARSVNYWLAARAPLRVT